MKGCRHPILIATIFLACAVIYGLAFYFVERPLTVTHEIYAGGLTQSMNSTRRSRGKWWVMVLTHYPRG